MKARSLFTTLTLLITGFAQAAAPEPIPNCADFEIGAVPVGTRCKVESTQKLFKLLYRLSLDQLSEANLTAAQMPTEPVEIWETYVDAKKVYTAGTKKMDYEDAASFCWEIARRMQSVTDVSWRTLGFSGLSSDTGLTTGVKNGLSEIMPTLVGNTFWMGSAAADYLKNTFTLTYPCSAAGCSTRGQLGMDQTASVVCSGD